MVSGQKLAVTFDDQLRAELRLNDVVVDAETALPNGPNVAAASAGATKLNTLTTAAQVPYTMRYGCPIERGSMYVYLFDSGGGGEPVFAQLRRQVLEGHLRAGLATTDPEVATEALYLLSLNWARQNDLSLHLLAEHRGFVPVYHHIMLLVKQESGFSVDIPVTITAVPKDGNTTDPGNNIRAILMMGSAMEHGVIEQNYPSYNAVSTVRYVRENNLAGGKTFLATPDNYGAIASDPDFIAGWSSARSRYTVSS